MESIDSHQSSSKKFGQLIVDNLEFKISILYNKLSRSSLGSEFSNLSVDEITSGYSLCELIDERILYSDIFVL